MIKSLNIPIKGVIITLILLIIANLTISMADSSDDGTGFLTAPSAGEPLEIALKYINEHKADLGLTANDIAEMLVTDKYASDNGITHIYFRQRHQGLEVFNANISVNIAKDGSIINLHNQFVPNLSEKIAANGLSLEKVSRKLTSAVDGTKSAAKHLGLEVKGELSVERGASGPDNQTIVNKGNLSLENIPAKLMYQVIRDNIYLVWDLEIYERDAQNYWNIRVDALNGSFVDKNNYVIHDNWGTPEQGHVDNLKSAAEKGNNTGFNSSNLLAGEAYNVYAIPVESPNFGSRTLVTDPADTTASPYGWHDTNGAAGAEYTITRGNNVHAYEDGNNTGFSPDGGSTLQFNFPINLAQHPDNYESAAITNLFYSNNVMHDILYQYGFNEASGNFQENNYGKGGSASDSVNAEAQDGGGTNNANFSTPSDGGNPRMQMYLWTLSSPYRDGDLDNGIIFHEYGHGVSIRLTGGPSNVSCLNNSEQGGEGWSDYFGLIFTIEPGDTGADSRGIGTYALNEPPTGDGIRDYPYSTNMSVDPRTYNEIKTAAVPHGVGSTWAAMIWEMTWALIDVHGYDADIYNGTGGNNIALQLVVDGLKLQPCSPGFVDARDAILQADQNNNGGANQCVIWNAFAKRGLGYSASQGSSGSRSDGTEAFDLPPACLTPTPTPTGPTATPTNTPEPGVCTTYTSADTPISLPNGTNSISSNINIPNGGTISDINVGVNMDHAWVGDISFAVSHNSTNVTIIDRPGVPASTYGCSGDNIVATLDDSAGTAVEGQCGSGTPTINGTFSPNNALSAFNGQAGNGNWTLTVTDHYPSADAGALNNWSVEVCTSGGGSTPTPAPTNTATPLPTSTSTPLPTNTPTTVPTNTPTPVPTNTPTPPPSGTVFSDNFETSQGWTTNASGTDTATTGAWERANPQGTTYNSANYQLDTTTSGSYNLSTGPLAGTSIGSYDIDNGVTSVRSPNITLPGSGNLTLSFSYYMAHLNNSSTADFFRVTVVGSSSSVVLEELGAANNDAAAWATYTGSLNSFAGQTVYLVFEAADASGGSLVEAAVDDVEITVN